MNATHKLDHQNLLKIALFLTMAFSIIVGSSKSMNPATTVPFNPDTLLIFVPVKLDGNGPFTFIIDTGAMASLINKTLANKLQAEKQEYQGMAMGFGKAKKEQEVDSLKIFRISFDTLEIGTLKHYDFKPFIMDISHIADAIGSPVDGVIGFDVLRNYEVVINYRSGEIIFNPLPEKPETTGTTFELFMNHVYVPARVAGKNFPFLLDTGASHCVLSSLLVDSLGLAPQLRPSRIDTLVGASGSGGEIRTYILDSLTIASRTVENIEIALVDLSPFSSVLGREIYGVVGHNFLRQFKLIINYRDMKIYLE